MECATSSSLINQLCTPPSLFPPHRTALQLARHTTALSCSYFLKPKTNPSIGGFCRSGASSTPPPPSRQRFFLRLLHHSANQIISHHSPTANLPPVLATPPATPPVSPSSSQNVQIPYLLAVDSTLPHTASKQTPRPRHKETPESA